MSIGHRDRRPRETVGNSLVKSTMASPSLLRERVNHGEIIFLMKRKKKRKKWLFMTPQLIRAG